MRPQTFFLPIFITAIALGYRLGAHRNGGTQTSSSRAPIPFATTFEDLYTQLSTEGVGDLQSAVMSLDDSFYSFGFYALAYSSRSVQESSARFPRLILFGKDHKLSLAFNHRLGTGSIEGLQWHEASKSWELREISFERGAAKLSEANPARCVKCHTSDPRPNWETYPTWPGLYGSSDQYIRPMRELPDFLSFWKNRTKDPIYGRLQMHEKQFAEESDDVLLSYLSDANTVISTELVNLNSQRVARRLHDQLKSKDLVYPILAIAGECQNQDNFIPGEEYPRLLAEEIKHTGDVAANAHLRLLMLVSQNDPQVLRQYAAGRAAFAVFPHDLNNIPYVARMRTLLGKFENLDLSDWSMSFQEREISLRHPAGTNFWLDDAYNMPKDYTFGLSRSPVRDVGGGLYANLIREFSLDLSITPQLDQALGGLTEATCNVLKERFDFSKVTAEDPSPRDLVPDAFLSDYELQSSAPIIDSSTASAILQNRCARCHVSGMVKAPPLKLGDPEVFAKFKNGRASQLLRTGNMPPGNGKDISREERIQLIRYFDEIYERPYTREFMDRQELPRGF